MNKFSYEFELAIKGLIEGRLNVDQVVALASGAERQASHIVTEALCVPNEPGGRHRLVFKNLLELAWRLIGPSKCVQFTFVGPEPKEATAKFLFEKLMESPDDFTDQDLASILQHWGEYPSLTDRLSSVQAWRLAAKAKQIQQTPRELTADVSRVKERVSAYHFPSELNVLLDKVETGLIAPGDGFDQAAFLKHLRTFFEQLHRVIAEKLHEANPATKDGTDLSKCQQVIDYLQRKGVIKHKLQTLGRALYGVLSEEGVHAIKSDREYVRLCRNMIAEYALIVFFEVDRFSGGTIQ